MKTRPFSVLLVRAIGQALRSRGSAEKRPVRYLSACLAVLVPIWLPTVLVLTLLPKQYSSAWTLTLPGSGATASFNIENIGQASSQAVSPYAGPSLSPKVIYKGIISSDTVLRDAAQSLAMDVKAFGKPNVKLVDQTALMYLKMNGNSPLQAKQKAKALIEAFEQRLDHLRRDEINRREAEFRAMLATHQTSLNEARQKLLHHQLRTSVVTPDQLERLAHSIESLTLEEARTRAEAEEFQAQAAQLQTQLNVDAMAAAAILTLQTDPVFQRALESHAAASLELAEASRKWGRRHPDIKRLTVAKSSAADLMEQRVSQFDELRTQPAVLLRLGTDEVRAGLFKSLILASAQHAGLVQRADQLSFQLDRMRIQLDQSSKYAAELEDLQRDHQIAEAVFTSALTRIDAGKSDLFASYPIIQMLDEPSTPLKPSSPKTLWVLAGATVGTLFGLLGLVLMWIRKPLLRRILKNA